MRNVETDLLTEMQLKRHFKYILMFSVVGESCIRISMEQCRSWRWCGIY